MAPNSSGGSDPGDLPGPPSTRTTGEPSNTVPPVPGTLKPSLSPGSPPASLPSSQANRLRRSLVKGPAIPSQPTRGIKGNAGPQVHATRPAWNAGGGVSQQRSPQPRTVATASSASSSSSTNASPGRTTKMPLGVGSSKASVPKRAPGVLLSNPGLRSNKGKEVDRSGTSHAQATGSQDHVSRLLDILRAGYKGLEEQTEKWIKELFALDLERQENATLSASLLQAIQALQDECRSLRDTEQHNAALIQQIHDRWLGQGAEQEKATLLQDNQALAASLEDECRPLRDAEEQHAALRHEMVQQKVALEQESKRKAQEIANLTIALNQERQHRQEAEQRLQTVKQARQQADGRCRELLAELAALKIQLAKVKHQHEQEKQGADKEIARLSQDLEEHQATLNSIVTAFLAPEEETGQLCSQLAEERQRVAQEKGRADGERQQAEQEKQRANEQRERVDQAIKDRDAARRELQGFLSDLPHQYSLLSHTNGDNILQPTPKGSGLTDSMSSLRKQQQHLGGGFNSPATPRTVATHSSPGITQVPGGITMHYRPKRQRRHRAHERHRRPRRAASISSLIRIMGDGRRIKAYVKRRGRGGRSRLFALAQRRTHR